MNTAYLFGIVSTCNEDYVGVCIVGQRRNGFLTSGFCTDEVGGMEGSEPD